MSKQTKLDTSNIRLHSTHLIWVSSLILFYLQQGLCVGAAHSSKKNLLTHTCCSDSVSTDRISFVLESLLRVLI